MDTLDINIQPFLEGSTLLVTGGTGSFGHSVVDRLLPYHPKEIRIFSRDEKKQLDMALKYTNAPVRFFIGDVRDKERVNDIMPGVDYIFYAAALKQVPHCEFFPTEALQTNALGAQNVMRCAIRHGVKRVVVLSTDKAVYPISVMGMTKALMERIMIATSREHSGDTIVCGTRYGNIMYTRGSVLPHFVSLIQQGKPLTLTNGEMTRFMASLPDSVSLVLYALAQGMPGGMYVKKMPAATMRTVAEALIDVFDNSTGIIEIGTRPGEKVHETLISSEELSRTQDCGEYYRILPEVPHMRQQSYYHNGVVGHSLTESYTSANTRQLNKEETKELLLSLPEVQHELQFFREKNRV